ncbi:hypothetical protein CLF_112052 [Clonorchis sinensis]|uniref:Uncharacterized protein n=1 Tax=Clonorchis sinensis TaxID=79923 RepID=H2KVE1_CLOSI|nr:hypothetical protein CLF_112052 [Clonorchis sinensis]
MAKSPSLHIYQIRKLDDLVCIAFKHYNPRPSLIAQRFKFNTRVERERITKPYGALTTGSSKNDMFRDRLVAGVRNACIQQFLLADRKLTLETAYNIAVALGAAGNNANLLRSVQPTVTSEEVHSSLEVSRIQHSPNRSQFKCYLRGGRYTHLKKRWQAQTVRNQCKKRDHLAKQCRSAPAFEVNSAVTIRSTR